MIDALGKEAASSWNSHSIWYLLLDLTRKKRELEFQKKSALITARAKLLQVYYFCVFYISQIVKKELTWIAKGGFFNLCH